MVSARVLKPVALCKMSVSPAVSRPMPCQLHRIKRDLFGSSMVASDSNVNRHISAEIERQQELAAQKWGFDFRAGCPLNANSTYIWEEVSIQESKYVPKMYTLTRAAHVRPMPAASSDMELLLNERAERENLGVNLTNSSLESTTDNESCYDSQDDSLPVQLNLPSCSSSARRHLGNAASTSTTATATRKRQLKITEFMKERKRLAQAPKKVSPVKRLRTSSGSSNAHIGHNSSISASLSGMLKRPRTN